MMGTIKLLVSSQLKQSKLNQKSSGFTLIELLIAIVIATLVLTPLLGFMINIMDTDRKEQAKATSTQEIQSALDYIAQDLEQAVYIYDPSGLNNASTDTTPGIKDQIPPVAQAVTGCKNTASISCVPVLVFWKREFRRNVLPPVTTGTLGDSTYVYSLVTYCLVKGNDTNETWSNAARIVRFQIRDGVKNPTTPTNTDGTPNYVSTNEAASKGFKLFDLTLSGTTLKEKMNRWQKASDTYTDNAFTLVDFIYQNSDVIPQPNCLSGQQVPSTLAGGFYACVDSSKNSAQIYIEGNALARTQKNSTYNANLSSYFPTASIQIKGRGLLGFN